MAIKRIHVNQHEIRKRCEQPLRLKTWRENRPASRIDILDRDGNVVASVVTQYEKPLSCGARVWIETQAICLVDGEAVL